MSTLISINCYPCIENEFADLAVQLTLLGAVHGLVLPETGEYKTGQKYINYLLYLKKENKDAGEVRYICDVDQQNFNGLRKSTSRMIYREVAMTDMNMSVMNKIWMKIIMLMTYDPPGQGVVSSTTSLVGATVNCLAWVMNLRE